jgi:GxxExxY protein
MMARGALKCWHAKNARNANFALCRGLEKIIVEIKAVSQLTDEHRAQMHNYLRATGFRLGLLVNFGYYPKIEYERIVL